MHHFFLLYFWLEKAANLFFQNSTVFTSILVSKVRWSRSFFSIFWMTSRSTSFSKILCNIYAQSLTINFYWSLYILQIFIATSAISIIIYSTRLREFESEIQQEGVIFGKVCKKILFFYGLCQCHSNFLSKFYKLYKLI